MENKLLPCPDLLSHDEILSLASMVISKHGDENSRRQNEYLNLYASGAIISNVMGIEYIFKKVEFIRERRPHLKTFEEMLDSKKSLERLKIMHLARVLQGIYCKKGFNEKIEILKNRNIDFYSIQYELEMACLAAESQCEIEFTLPLSDMKIPDFIIKENDIDIGCECKYNHKIVDLDNNAMIIKFLEKIRKAGKQIYGYQSSLIFLGGFFSKERYFQIQNDLKKEISPYFERHPEINAVIITPIEINMDLNKTKMHHQINDYWIENPNPNHKLSLAKKFKQQEKDGTYKFSILGDLNPFPTPAYNIDRGRNL